MHRNDRAWLSCITTASDLGPLSESYSREYVADLIVDDLVIIEVKAVKMFIDEHEAQLLNYLKATHFEVGLLLNFGPKPEQKRVAFENTRKEWWLQQANQEFISKK